MANVVPLKFTAKLICIQTLLDLSGDGDKEAAHRMLRQLQTGCYTAVSCGLLRRLVERYPGKVTNNVLSALASTHLRELKLKKCKFVSFTGLKNVLESCPLVTKLDLSECDQFSQPEVFHITSFLRPGITALSLENCLTVDNTVVQSILSYMKTLQHLNLAGCTKLTDNVFLLNENLQLQRETFGQMSQDRYDCSLISVDISGTTLTSTAVRHLATLTGPTLRHVNISWTGADTLALLYLSGYGRPSIVDLTLSDPDTVLDRSLKQSLLELKNTLKQLQLGMFKKERARKGIYGDITENNATDNDSSSSIDPNPEVIASLWPSKNHTEVTASLPPSKRNPEETASLPSSKGHTEVTASLPPSKGHPEETASLPPTKGHTEVTASLPPSKGHPEETASLPSTKGHTEVTASLPPSKGHPEEIASLPSTKGNTEVTASFPPSKGHPEETASLPSTKGHTESTASLPPSKGLPEETASLLSTKGHIEVTASLPPSKGHEDVIVSLSSTTKSYPKVKTSSLAERSYPEMSVNPTNILQPKVLQNNGKTVKYTDDLEPVHLLRNTEDGVSVVIGELNPIINFNGERSVDDRLNVKSFMEVLEEASDSESSMDYSSEEEASDSESSVDYSSEEDDSDLEGSVKSDKILSVTEQAHVVGHFNSVKEHSVDRSGVQALAPNVKAHLTGGSDAEGQSCDGTVHLIGGADMEDLTSDVTVDVTDDSYSWTVDKCCNHDSSIGPPSNTNTCEICSKLKSNIAKCTSELNYKTEHSEMTNNLSQYSKTNTLYGDHQHSQVLQNSQSGESSIAESENSHISHNSDNLGNPVNSKNNLLQNTYEFTCSADSGIPEVMSQNRSLEVKTESLATASESCSGLATVTDENVEFIEDDTGMKYSFNKNVKSVLTSETTPSSAEKYQLPPSKDMMSCYDTAVSKNERMVVMTSTQDDCMTNDENVTQGEDSHNMTCDSVIISDETGVPMSLSCHDQIGFSQYRATGSETGVSCSETGVSCSETGVSFSETGVSCSETGVSCSETGVSCSETGVSCSETGVSCSETGVSCSETGVSCSETGVSCSETGVSCSEMGVSCSETGVSCSESRVSCSETGITCIESGVTCSESEVKCSESGMTCVESVVKSSESLFICSESGMICLESGSKNSECGFICLESGVTCSGSGETCSESGVTCSESGVTCSEPGVTCSVSGVTCSESGVTCSESGVTCSEPGVTCSESGVTCSESGVTCSESGVTCSEPGVTCSESGVTCSESGVTCSESGVTCSEPGVTCSESGVTCSESGVTCSESGVTCSESGVTCSESRVKSSGSGVTCSESGVTCSESGVTCSEPGVTCSEFGVTCSESRVTCSESRVTCSESGVTCSESGVTCSESGVTCSELGVTCSESGVTCSESRVKSSGSGVTCSESGVTCSESGVTCSELWNDLFRI
ncbi:papilin-like [Pecten maximus]|uniref:papilin-like n=1 Tax=Pecten maximus TaxID=6579 RepID=UPI001458EDD5|nr:papilin-like [Pecten maximus]